MASCKNAISINAFSISLPEFNFYAFPPFSLIGAAIEKVRQEKCSEIMIIPWWKKQLLFPMMVSLLKYFPILFSPNLLTLPSKRSAKHPLYLEMKLLAVHLSGKTWKTQTFQWKLRCYRRFLLNNHLKSLRISLQAMVCLCKFKEHGSLYSRCKYSVVIHAWYVHNWLFVEWFLGSTQSIV